LPSPSNQTIPNGRSFANASAISEIKTVALQQRTNAHQSYLMRIFHVLRHDRLLGSQNRFALFKEGFQEGDLAELSKLVPTLKSSG